MEFTGFPAEILKNPLHPRYRVTLGATAASLALAFWEPLSLLLVLVSFVSYLRLRLLLPFETNWLERIAFNKKELGLEEAARLTQSPPLASGYAARWEGQARRLELLLDSGDHLEASKLFSALDRKALTSREAQRLKTLTAYFYYQVGDTLSFLQTVENWPSSEVAEDAGRTVLLALARQTRSKYAQARELLRRSIDRHFDSDCALLVLYNNLANLEALAQRPQSQIRYLESAMHYMRCRPTPDMLPSIVHNLVIAYIRQGDSATAKARLHEASLFIDRSKPAQVLELYNLSVEAARAAADTEWLSEVHRSFSQLPQHPQVTKAQRLAFAVCNLRMHRNDGVSQAPSNYLENIDWLLKNLSGVKASVQVAALMEISGDLLQRIHNQGFGKFVYDQLIEKLDECNARVMERENIITAHLQQLPPNLVTARSRWLNYHSELHKIGIQRAGEAEGQPYPAARLERLFAHHREVAEMYKEQLATHEAVDSLLTICHEFCAYRTQFPPQWRKRFILSFQHAAEHALTSAERSLELADNYMSLEAHLVGTAYFVMQLRNDNLAAAAWLERFRNTGYSLHHLEDWLRQQYFAVESVIPA